MQLAIIFNKLSIFFRSGGEENGANNAVYQEKLSTFSIYSVVGKQRVFLGSAELELSQYTNKIHQEVYLQLGGGPLQNASL